MPGSNPSRASRYRCFRDRAEAVHQGSGAYPVDIALGFAEGQFPLALLDSGAELA